LSPSRRLIGAAVGLLLGAAAATGLPPSPVAAAPSAVPAPAALSGRLTLITGDVVTLTPSDDGRVAAAVRPGAGREEIRFSTVETKAGVRILPSDALPLLKAGRLDADLFDVQRLLTDGYGDTATPVLPLIVESAAATGTMRTAGTALPSIGAVAVRADKKTLADFWRTEAAAGANARSAATAPRIWLDGKVRAALDRSAAQIGAPTAWQAGLDGRGIKVAVLDTGVDATHPDLVGKIAEARDFSGSPDTTDHFGHGTHVAATVAGTGAASGGTRKGVAYGAQLLIGKVLDDSGSGYESGIIEGMEWAAAAGARVVNMSLGGSATDGTDPMSAAVDRISNQSGTLFVVAAGNEGADYTVGTPGAATSALTVGAVDRDDALADFSSRGPRVGDLGLKPEITAPGVDIVAARAAGTEMGTVVDDFYTAASGTSMATPHVAGAAAILAQQHPDWTGAQLKDGLVSTARTVAGTSVFSQGAGRVDVARAVTQPVVATGVADFGLHDTGESPAKVTKIVSYRNAGTTPVTLTLKSTVPAMTAPASVTVPAGGATDVTLTFDLATATRGLQSGWLTATATGISLTTALAGTLDPPHHRVTFSAVGRDGKPAAVPVFQMFGDDQRFDVLGFLGVGESGWVDVAEGDYLVDASISGPGDEDTLVTKPELRVDRDLTVVLDARPAREVKIETPQPSEQRTVFSYYVHRVLGNGRSVANGFMDFSSTRHLYVTPTAPVRKGTFEFSSRWQRVAPLSQGSVAGVAGPLEMNLMGTSPAANGTRRYDLVAGLGGNVRGKAVVLDPGPDFDEYARVQEAAAAGAAVALVVRPADWGTWTSWQPDGERLPITGLVTGPADGDRILARAKKPGATLTLTLTPDSPYLYDVLQVSAGRVPDQIVHRVTTANSRRIATDYADNGGFDWAREQRFGWRPWQGYAWNDAQRSVHTPSSRVEWVSTGDSIWQHYVHPAYPWNDLGNSLDVGLQDAAVSYPRAGTEAESWFAPVVRPGTPPGAANARTGDVLNLRVAQFLDATDRHWMIDQPDTDGSASAELYRNGALLAELPDAWDDVPVPAGDASYRLELSTTRGGAEWIHATSTSTAWTFRSAKAGKLPLLQPSYDVPARTRTAHLIKVDVPGARTVRVETSADDGATWKAAFTLGSATLVPGGAAPVSLRVTATDKAGNSVRQTVVRAYGRG
jgi:subtilisin family serine protease